MMVSTKLLLTKYLRIFCSAPLRYNTPGNSTMAAVPSALNQLSMCMVKAKSALLLGASTPAGENEGR